ncbi:hypothetical protein BRADI_3g01583v3 [Brachypodium distachyon]|uniref:Uncharacterized protein n=1 Tax=Brachypodium distachyon TaxID=15368 RepID=A0A2K2CUP0_BRADI|nr:hypothetical protein BRADI_3g01583v3 [Brachypodium distachyon]
MSVNNYIHKIQFGHATNIGNQPFVPLLCPQLPNSTPRICLRGSKFFLTGYYKCSETSAKEELFESSGFARRGRKLA